jgi:peptidoglycan/LPS O-acetylase OafA/YrhL
MLLILLFSLSWASFEFVEKPILKLKRFFEYRKDRLPSKSPDKEAIQGANEIPVASPVQ